MGNACCYFELLFLWVLVWFKTLSLRKVFLSPTPPSTTITEVNYDRKFS